jgi:hypothetical protein
MAAMLVWAAVQYGRLASRVKTAVRMEGEKHVYQSENIPTPFILGLFPPKIYVPYHMDSVSAWQVLSHERTHLRLGDHLIKPAAYLILTLHWFNPLCWLAFALLGRDVEMRCDEAVLAYADPKEYGTALVKLAAEKRYSVTGPLAFAVLMGIGWVLHVAKGKDWDLRKFIIVCSALCLVSYLMISLVPNPVVNLIGCALCGFAIAIMWPGTLSLGAKALPRAGTAMFALLALAGDVGCSIGPTLVGVVSGCFGDNLKLGILSAILFPAVLLLCVLFGKLEEK